MVVPPPIGPRALRPIGWTEHHATNPIGPNSSYRNKPISRASLLHRNKANSGRHDLATKQTQFGPPRACDETNPIRARHVRIETNPIRAATTATKPGRVRCADHSIDKTEGPHSGPYPHRNKPNSGRNDWASKQTQFGPQRLGIETNPIRAATTATEQTQFSSKPGRVRCADHSIDKTEGPHSGPYPHRNKPNSGPHDPASKQTQFGPPRRHSYETNPIRARHDRDETNPIQAATFGSKQTHSSSKAFSNKRLEQFTNDWVGWHWWLAHQCSLWGCSTGGQAASATPIDRDTRAGTALRIAIEQRPAESISVGLDRSISGLDPRAEVSR